MEEEQSRSSWLARAPGVFALFVFAVIAEYFQAWLLSAFFFLLFFLCGSAFLWSGRVLRRVEISLTPLCGGCHAGEWLSLKLRIRNHSFFPLVWLDVILPMGERPLVRQEGGTKPFWYLKPGEQKAQAAIRQRVAWLLWQQEIEWQERAQALCRGTAQLMGAGLFAGDGSGLSARTSWYPFVVPVTLTIYPRLLPVDVQPFLRLSQETEAGRRGQMEDVTWLKSSRPYRPGDPMKRINWRLLAGSGRMEVDVYETMQPGCTLFVLDLLSFRIVKKQDDPQGGDHLEVFLRERELERMVSLVASCIRELAGRKMMTALMLPAYGEREAVLCMPGGEGYVDGGSGAFWQQETCYETAATNALRELARLDYRAEMTWFPDESSWQAVHHLDSVCICMRTDQGTPLEELTEQLGQNRVWYLAGEGKPGGSQGHDRLYGESLCQDPKAYREAEEEVPEEVRIGPLLRRDEAGGEDVRGQKDTAPLQQQEDKGA